MLAKPQLKFSGQTALIDWLRFTCLFPFDDPRMEQVLSLLKVDRNRPTIERNSLGPLGYQKTLTFDEDLKVGVEPLARAKVRGALSQFTVDISGHACRCFELRGGQWDNLLSHLDSLGPLVRFNRIDLALDDIDGCLDVKSLKRKISDQRFTSAFRGRKANGKVGSETFTLAQPEQDDLSDGPLVFDTRKGYTCTFGSRSGECMLNIYDKLAERDSKGIVVGVSEWVRFEASLTRGKCQSCIRAMIVPSLKEERFGQMVASIVHGFIEFKEGKGYDRATGQRNIDKLPIWREYQKFLKGAEAIKVPSNQARVEGSVERTVRWAEGYWNSSLLKLFALKDSALGEVVRHFAQRLSEDGISEKEMAQIRNYLLARGECMSDSEILNSIQEMISMYPDANGEVKDVADAYYERRLKDRMHSIICDRPEVSDDEKDDLPLQEERR